MFPKSARPLIFAIIIMFFLSACSAKANNPAALVETVIPEVISTASSVDLMDLESLSFIPGDLPEGFATAESHKNPA